MKENLEKKKKYKKYVKIYENCFSYNFHIICAALHMDFNTEEKRGKFLAK